MSILNDKNKKRAKSFDKVKIGDPVATIDFKNGTYSKKYGGCVVEFKGSLKEALEYAYYGDFKLIEAQQYNDFKTFLKQNNINTQSPCLVICQDPYDRCGGNIECQSFGIYREEDNMDWNDNKRNIYDCVVYKGNPNYEKLHSFSFQNRFKMESIKERIKGDQT